MSKQIEDKVEAFKRGLLNEALEQCTVEQQAFFNKLYPKGISNKDLISAIDLCERTIAKNKKLNRV